MRILSVPLGDQLRQLCGDMPSGKEPWFATLDQGAEIVKGTLKAYAIKGYKSVWIGFKTNAQATAVREILCLENISVQMRTPFGGSPILVVSWGEAGIRANQPDFTVSDTWEITPPKL